MSPRYRRLLIPGLLLALLVVVLVSSLAHGAERAEPGPVVVSRITDPRVTESSGLAMSRAHPGLAYTINDSNNPPYVFAIEVSTGDVVGVTRIEGGTLRDTEAIAIAPDGTLWVADTGDNTGTREDAALYAFAEPGPGDRTVVAKRYPISYEDGPVNVEALLIDPRTGAKHLVSKGALDGKVFALPALERDTPAVATFVDATVPPLITDGSFTTGGSYAVLRSYTSVYVVDPSSWAPVRSGALPRQPQGESIAMEPSGRSLLIGSEGVGSALIRVLFAEPATATSPGPEPTAVRTTPAAADADGDGFAGHTWGWSAVALVTLVALGALLSRRRR